MSGTVVVLCTRTKFFMSILGFKLKLVLIKATLYYIFILRKTASLPADLSTGEDLTARFPPVVRRGVHAHGKKVQKFN